MQSENNETLQNEVIKDNKKEKKTPHEEFMEYEDKSRRKRRAFTKFILLILVIIILWFALTIYEFYRAKTEKRPLFCFNETKAVVDNDEYSITCYGPLYKYREYFNNQDDRITAREFNLYFMEFDRDA